MSEHEKPLAPNPDNYWVCHMCHKDFEHVAFLPNSEAFCVIKWEDKFHFVGSSDQGHDGSIWITFDADPFAEPSDMDDTWDTWNEPIMQPFIDLGLSILDGYDLYSACLAAGYDPESDDDGHVYYWLAHWTGQAVADFKKKVAT